MSSQSRSRSNVFAALELDRGSEHRDDATWLAEHAAAPGARYFLLDSAGRALLSADRRTLNRFGHADCGPLLVAAAPSFLGSAAGIDHFFLHVDSAAAERLAAEHSGEFVDLRRAGASLPAFDAGLFAYARGLALWQQRMRFCNACAAPLMLESSGHRAKCTNPQCALEHFPRTDPAIIVIVEHAGRCLLGRGPQWPERRFSTLAGFVEPGETLEDAVRREVFEESGVLVGDCDYHSSQPWPFPASIMLGFTAQALDPTIRLGHELAEARWFSVDELVDGLRARTLGLSSPVSVSYRLIEHWLRATAGIELSQFTHDDPFVATRV
ncbi:MAG: NAD(+) diphosphatase [Rudaea sp.]